MKYSTSLTNAALIILAGFLSLLVACTPSKMGDNLEANFKNPPASARPKTWMHAMSGNMSKEGLTKDLEAMADVGLGGLLLFNIAQGIPYGQVNYNSELHHEMIKHAASECERLDLSFGVHNCDGWSSSGGPWIKPEQSMKMVVWSETQVEGGALDLQLPQPTKRDNYYEDVAVLAYPSLASELDDAENQPVITSSDPLFDVSGLADNSLEDRTILRKQGDSLPWIQYFYPNKKTIRSVLMVCNQRDPVATLQVSDNGVDFTNVRQLYEVRTGKREWVINDSFDPVKSKYFRVTFDQTMSFHEAKLLSTQNIHNTMGRISMGRTEDQEMTPIGKPSDDMIIQKNQIVDLSEKLHADGVLEAHLPEGNWTILRFGYTTTGAFNHPASNIGRGLECDKFSREAFKIHYDAFVSKVIQNTKSIAPNAMQYIEIDSYEMGGQNWTDGYAQMFKKRYDYDIIHFLPIYAGRFVESAEISDAVTSDIRRFNCDLMTENYFGYFAELCKADGIKSYIEPYGFGPVNDLDVGAKADINMGEFWMNRPINMVQSAVSASHIYGKTITSAESFTSTPQINWKGHPAMAKTSGDLAWCYGINEFMFHRFAHQANTHVKPGMTMNRWGFHFDRTQTWWNNAGKDWFQYIARGSYLLRQGNPVSDLLVFVGDGAPNSVFKRNDFNPPIPAGTKFDNTNADVLINRIRVENGKMVLPEGTEYQLLVLQNSEKTALKTLQRIDEINSAGIPVVGKKPIGLPGYNNSAKDQAAFEKLVDKIWSSSNVYTDFNWSLIFRKEGLKPDLAIEKESSYEFMHRKTEDVDIYFLFNPEKEVRQMECTFRVDGMIPEFWDPINGEIRKIGRFAKAEGGTKVWLNLESEQSAFVVFRESSSGLNPAVLSDNSSMVEYHFNNKKQLVLTATENGAVQTTFAKGKEVESVVQGVPVPYDIKGSWKVEFRKEDDYEAAHIFEALGDWKDHPVDEIKYYSGTAIYNKTFRVEDQFIAEDIQTILDLGEVAIVAEVWLNDKFIGIDWMPPYRQDVTENLIKGENKLVIKVTNQWSNRLIGDERYPKQDGGYRYAGSMPKDEDKMPDWYVNNQPMPQGPRTTFCTGNFYKDGDELMPSGLLGPVRFIAKKEIIIK